MAARVQDAVGQVTTEEFTRQDSRFERDSRLGRELLYLIAHDEWIRGTTELADLSRSQTVDTTIRVNIDLGQLSHEAFNDEAGRLSLPLLILPGIPPGGSTGTAGTGLTPDVVATDAAGTLLPTLPQTEIHQRLAAALAEIFLSLGSAHLPDREQGRSDRDARLVLAAALYKYLRRGGQDSDPGPEPRNGTRYPVLAARVKAAADRVRLLLKHYAQPCDQPGDQPCDDVDAALAERAARVLGALRGGSVIAVSVERGQPPTMISVELPARLLEARRRLIRRPWAELDLELLLPSGRADRQVRVRLPDGVACARRPDGEPRADLELSVAQPRAVKHLKAVMDQVVAQGAGRAGCSPTVLAALSELALTHFNEVTELFGTYRVPSGPEGERLRTRLADLRQGLLGLRHACRGPEGEKGDRELALTVERVIRIWADGTWLPETLHRRSRVMAPNRHEVVVHLDAVDSGLHQGTPRISRLSLVAVATDLTLRSAAVYTGAMGLALITVILLLSLAAGGSVGNPEVLASVLTLFAAVQAGRVDHPDQSTLRGLLGSAGYIPVVASVLPPILLAVALAFIEGDRDGKNLTRTCMVLALFAQLALLIYLRLMRAEALDRSVRSPRLRLATAPVTGTDDGEVLHSHWWQGTCAEALLIDRGAVAYLVHQGAPPEERGGRGLLPDLLDVRPRWPRRGATGISRRPSELPDIFSSGNGTEHDGPGPVRTAFATMVQAGAAKAGLVPQEPRPPSILALLRSGTSRQSLTYVVFREEPDQDWVELHRARPVPVDLDRVDSPEAPLELVEVLLGLSGGSSRLGDHPLGQVLHATAQAGLPIVDVQLPVPAPEPTAEPLTWARVRVAVHEARLPSLAGYVRSLAALVDDGTASSWALGIGLRGAAAPVWLRGPARTAHREDPHPLLAEDLDVVQDEDPDLRRWWVLAITGRNRAGLETEVVDRLAKTRGHLNLAGVTIAAMPGNVVMFLLLRDEQAPDPPATNVSDLETGIAGVGLRVWVNTWVTARELGTRSDAGRRPVVRVHTRTQEAPGGMALTLQALNRALETVRSVPPRGETVERVPAAEDWYVLVRVLEGRIATAVFTIRVAADLVTDQVAYGRALAQAEHGIRRALSQGSRQHRVFSTSADSHDALDETVVAVVPLYGGTGPRPVSVDLAQEESRADLRE
ncbi:MAG: hypothetical protein P8Z68_07415 [Kineosporiaceae bacterium]